MKSRGRLVLPMVVGIVLGLGARLVDDVAARWVGNIGAVWFLAAFFVGRSQRSLRQGASAGALSLVSATLMYYAWRVIIDGTISTRYLFQVGVFWLLAGAVTGAVSGAVGAKSHRWSLAWGVAIGVLVGEAAAVVLLSQRMEQIALELAAAIVLFFYSKRRLTKILPSAVATAMVVTFGVYLYRIALR